jgi:hypothetical protein
VFFIGAHSKGDIITRLNPRPLSDGPEAHRPCGSNENHLHQVRIKLFGVSAMATGSDHSCSLRQLTALISFVLLGTAIAGSWDSRPTKATPASAFQLVDTSGQNYYANAHPYLEKPLEQLVQLVPALRTLQPAADQRALSMVLARTSAKVEDFFQEVVDLVAHEEITQERLSPKGSVKSSRHTRYNYLILIHRDEITPRIEEYRTDLQGNRAEQEGLDKGYSVVSGFALKCIHFLPSLRSGSTFLYLGDEVIGPRNTYVVAFAQQPGQSRFTGTLRWEGRTVPILVQGIAWVDKDSFQIIRMRTDLLAPRSDIGLVQETTELTLGEVQLPDLPKPLWLPRDVNVYSVFKGQIFRNEHRYTNYERFRVSVNIVPQ